MASINMKILTSAHEYGKIFKARGINESLEIMDITVFTSDNSKQQTDKITRGEFIKLMGYTLSQESSLKTIKLNMKSRVFETTPFTVPQDIEDKYYSAAVVSVPEALASGSDRRVTMDGIVKNVSPLKEGATWRRKDFRIYDPQTKSSIKCNLWGPHADQDIRTGVHATISNVETSIYNSIVSVNTTVETAITIKDNSPEFQCTIVAYSADDQNRTTDLVTSTDDVYSITNRKLDLILDSKCLKGIMPWDVMMQVNASMEVVSLRSQNAWDQETPESCNTTD